MSNKLLTNPGHTLGKLISDWLLHKLGCFSILTGGNQGTEACLTTIHDHHQTKHYDVCWLHSNWSDFEFGGYNSDEACEWARSSAVACHISHMPHFDNDFTPQWVADSIEKKCVLPVIYLMLPFRWTNEYNEAPSHLGHRIIVRLLTMKLWYL